MSLDCRRKLEYTERVHIDTGKHAISTQNEPSLNLNPDHLTWKHCATKCFIGSVQVFSHPGRPGSLERKRMDFFKFLENILPFIWEASKKKKTKRSPVTFLLSFILFKMYSQVCLQFQWYFFNIYRGQVQFYNNIKNSSDMIHITWRQTFSFTV